MECKLFYQWGVELGKKLAIKLTEHFNKKNQNQNFSNSTLNLLNKIRKLKNND